MNPKLSVEIGADIKGMEAALKKADALLKQHERNYKGYQNAISQSTQKSQQLEKSISSLNTQYKRGQISQSQYSKETDRLTNELLQVNKETSDYQKELRRLDREIDRVAQSTANYSNNANRVGSASNNATAGMNRLGNATRVNAVPAMTSFSQVIQDAPYGIRGVANNITQLTSQMGYLAKSTGGVGGALKALGSSLMGPAGILLGVSLVTSALVTYGDKLFSSKSKTEKLKDETEKAREELDNFISTLNTLNQVEVSAAVDVAKEKVELAALVKQMTDANNATEKRNAALNELKRRYPAILSGIDDERLLNKGLAGSYQEIISLLNERAKSLNSVEREKTNAEEIVKLTRKEEQAQADLNKQLSIADFWKKEAEKEGRSSKLWVKYAEEAKEAEKLEEALRNLQGRRQSLELENVDLAKNTTLVAEDPKIDVQGNATTNKPIKLDAEIDLDLENEAIENAKLIEDLEIEGRMDNAKLEAQYLYDLKQAEDRFFADSSDAWMNHTENLKEVADETDKIAMQMQMAIGNMISNMIFDLIDGKDAFKDFGRTILKTFVGIGINALTGGLMGGLFGGAFSNGGIVEPKGFASGGIIGGSSFSGDKLWARVNSGEMVLNDDQQRNLYSQLQSASAVGIANNSPIIVGGAIEARGDVLRVILDRSDNRRGRAT